MTAVKQNKIVNNSSNKGIIFHYAERAQDAITINAIKITQPGQSADNNYIANWGGFNRIITIDFVLYDDGTDKSTDTQSKITLEQQWDYLMDTVVQTPGGSDSVFDILYTLTMVKGAVTTPYTGMIDNINVNWSPDGSNKLVGTLSLIVGTN